MRTRIPVSTRRRKRQAGQELMEFALVAVLFVPLLIGMFVTGMNLIKSIQIKTTTRDMASMYIQGTDYSTFPAQQLTQRLGTGLNLQFPTFSGHASDNTGSSGDMLIWVSQIEYVGPVSSPNCVAVGAANCTNHDQFVFLQRIRIGNNTLTSQHDSSLGNPTGATISSMGFIQNPITDASAALQGSAQTNFQALWSSPLADGQVVYVVESFVQTPTLGLGSMTSTGVYARYLF